MLLDYEKEILKNSNEAACLTILAKGLEIDNSVEEILKLYSNENCLALILNLSKEQLDFLNRGDRIIVENVTKLSLPIRRQKFKAGGVFYGSSRSLITDFINNNIQISKISCIIVMNAENIKPDSTESFILYLFKKHNTLGLIKAFTSCPLEIFRTGLSEVSRLLNLNKILFFPRFHETIQSSLPELNTTQIFLKQSKTMLEIAFMIEEMIKKIKVFRQNDNTSDFDIMNVLLYRQLNKNVANFKKLISLVYNSDSLSAYLFYKSMIDVQRLNNSESSWIFAEQSHILLDALNNLLIIDIEKAKIEKSEFIYDIDSGSFRIGVIDNPVEMVEVDNQFSESQQDSESNDVLFSSKIMESQTLSKFYLSNLKIKKICDIINEKKNIQTAILVQSRFIKRSLRNALESLNLINSVKILTYGDARREAEMFKRYILMSPDLGFIRYMEYIGIHLKEPEIFILIYKNSFEEQRFLMEIIEEKNAFENMIDERSKLPLRMELETVYLDSESEEKEYEIVVDSREMRAKLPFYLYKAGNKIDIRVLEIGDYLVGKNRCIERKAIEDFIGSLNSGRLYQQAQRMTHSYQAPILFLEFKDIKPCLIDFETAQEFRNTLIARFCLFLYNFPNFEIIWSNSQIGSVRLIREIQKREQEEKVSDSKIDPILYEILLCIPGVNSSNVFRILDEYKCLLDLCLADMPALERILDHNTALQIYSFFRVEFGKDPNM